MVNILGSCSNFSRFLLSISLILVWFFEAVEVSLQKKETVQIISSLVKQVKEKNLQEVRCAVRKRVLLDLRYYSPAFKEQLQTLNVDVTAVEMDHLNHMVLDDVDVLIVGCDARSRKIVHLMRNKAKHLRIVGVSQEGKWSELMELLDSGMDGTVCYPLDVKEIVGIINR